MDAARITRAYKLRQQPVEPWQRELAGVLFCDGQDAFPQRRRLCRNVCRRGHTARLFASRQQSMEQTTSLSTNGLVLRSRTLEQRGGDMTHAPSIDPERRHAERLEIARKLYQALVAQDPGRVITLCDGGGEVVAQHDRRPDQSDLEIETRGGLTLQKNGPGDAPLGQ
jgi:hypothetical protein